MASTSRYGRPAWVLGGGGTGSAISPCPWHRRENGRVAPAAPGEEPVAIVAFARPRCPRLGAALGSRRLWPLSGCPCLWAALCAAPGVAGGRREPGRAGPPGASPCGPGRAGSEGPPAVGSAGAEFAAPLLHREGSQGKFWGISWRLVTCCGRWRSSRFPCGAEL